MFIIASVIGSIMKMFTGQQNTQSKPKMDPREIFREFMEGNTGAGTGTGTGTGTGAPIYGGTSPKNIQNPVAPQKSMDSLAGQAGLQTTAQTGIQTGTSLDDVTPPLQVISLDDESGKYNLEITRSSLLNGIIISEILQPPKSKRI